MSGETEAVVTFITVIIGFFVLKFLFVAALVLAVVLPVAAVAFVGYQAWVVLRPIVVPVAVLGGFLIVIATRLAVVAALAYGAWRLLWWWLVSE